MTSYCKRVAAGFVALAMALVLAGAFAPMAYAETATSTPADQFDKGSFTIDLTKGNKVLPAIVTGASATSLSFGDGVLAIVCLGAAEEFDESIKTKSVEDNVVDVDLDKNGSYDMRIAIDSLDNPKDITFSKLDTTSIEYSKTISLSANAKTKIAENDQTDYYSTLTIVFNPTPEKAANTLKVKGKTVRLKYAKLAKKTRKLKRSAVLKVSKAKGKVTYKKIKGNKKITIKKKTGKVIVKKGLKKGVYKIKVAVKAAGNSDYKPKTKKVTFTVKVK